MKMIRPRPMPGKPIAGGGAAVRPRPTGGYGKVEKPGTPKPSSGMVSVGKPVGVTKPVDKRPLPKPVAKPAGQLAGAMKAPTMMGAGKSPAGMAKPGAMKAPKADALKQAVKFAKQRMGKM